MERMLRGMSELRKCLLLRSLGDLFELLYGVSVRLALYVENMFYVPL